MKKISILLLLCVMLFAIPACQKYEDGPMFSLRSKKARVDGDWRVTKLEFNNNNVLQDNETLSYLTSCGYINYNSTSTISNYNWTFNKSGTFNSSYNLSQTYINTSATYTNCYAVYETTNGSQTENGTWEFTDNKEGLILKYNTAQRIYTILALKNNEIHLRYTSGQDVIDFHLEQ